MTLKPLSVNKTTISDPFKFAEKIRQTGIKADEILVSYDVTSLFTNVPVDETIQLLADKAFKGNWFNKKNKLNITKTDLIKLLRLVSTQENNPRIGTKFNLDMRLRCQFFAQFEAILYL